MVRYESTRTDQRYVTVSYVTWGWKTGITALSLLNVISQPLYSYFLMENILSQGQVRVNLHQMYYIAISTLIQKLVLLCRLRQADLNSTHTVLQ